MRAPAEHRNDSSELSNDLFNDEISSKPEDGSPSVEDFTPAYVDSDPVAAAASARSLSEKVAKRKNARRAARSSASEAEAQALAVKGASEGTTQAEGEDAAEAEGEDAAAPVRSKKATVKAVVFLAVLLLLVIVDRATGLSSSLINGDLQMKLVAIQENHFLLAMLIWCAIVTLGCALLALPVWAFSAAAGALFGAWSGSVVVAVSTTCGAVLAFIAGRYFLQETAQPLAMKSKWLKKWLMEEESNASTVLVVTRLIPVIPYNIQNLAYGVADISLSRFTLYTFLFMLPSNTGICIAASALASPLSIPGVCLGFLLIAGSVMAGLWVLKNKMQVDLSAAWNQRKNR